MRVLINLFAAAALVVTVPAAAQSTPHQTDRPAPTTANPDRMVCKKEEKIGSRLQAKKVCLTASEWRDLHQAERETAEKIQSGARTRCEGCPDDMGKVF